MFRAKGDGVMKTCKSCCFTKTKDAFPLNARNEDGRDDWCERCHKEKIIERRVYNKIIKQIKEMM